MRLDTLKTRLQAQHHHDPQSVQTVVHAIGEIERGLGLLSRLGHVFHLEDGPPYDLPEWPKVLFHVEAAPNGRTVQSEWEAEELGPGWWNTLAEAQQKEGLRAQFAGRGGVRGRSVPMLVDGPAAPRPDLGPRNDNTVAIEEWKRRHQNGHDETPG